MKMVARRARQAMTMRQCFAVLRSEQVWTLVPGVLFDTWPGVAVLAGEILAFGFGNFLGSRGIAAGLVETAVEELGGSAEMKTVGELEGTADCEEDNGLPDLDET